MKLIIIKLRDSYKRLSSVLVMILASVSVFAQNTISGTVTDETGSPVIGVAVQIEGTTGGVITDMDGPTKSLQKRETYSYSHHSATRMPRL